MTTPSDEAEAHLKRAYELHSAHRTPEALAEAQAALELRPNYVEALTYIGTTLVTRRLAFAEGLGALERAAEIAPEDAGVEYSLGWAEEFVAYRLEKQATTPYRDPLDLYELAAEHLQRCIDLNPEQGLKDDAHDLLDAVNRRLE